MQTEFTPQQLQDPAFARSNRILRSCVHCGFCTATCPTYQLLGDELDSPRGRIYLIKQMLEGGRKPDVKTVLHIDRCLSCLACMTTCPSGVHYMHLVDHAREYIAQNYRRPWHDAALRWLLGRILPYPNRFRLALALARLARPFRSVLPDPRLRAMLEMAPRRIAPPSVDDVPQVFPALGERRMRAALMTGCAQRVLKPDINEATVRLLTRHGCEVVVAGGAGCCGALDHHMGSTDASHAHALRNLRAWSRELDGPGLDAIVINASGCGTTVKDYGHMLRGSSEAELAKRVSAMTRDVSEVMAELTPEPQGGTPRLRVAYHAACSLQHGQQIRSEPKALLTIAGFDVVEPAEAHLCCGSAGTYNLLQPEIANRLQARKVGHLRALRPDVVAAGNIGCIMQIASGIDAPVVHIVELLDWATGGPVPDALRGRAGAAARSSAGGP